MPPRAQHLDLARDDSIVRGATVISRSFVMMLITDKFVSRLRLCLRQGQRTVDGGMRIDVDDGFPCLPPAQLAWLLPRHLRVPVRNGAGSVYWSGDLGGWAA